MVPSVGFVVTSNFCMPTENWEMKVEQTLVTAAICRSRCRAHVHPCDIAVMAQVAQTPQWSYNCWPDCATATCYPWWELQHNFTSAEAMQASALHVVGPWSLFTIDVGLAIRFLIASGISQSSWCLLSIFWNWFMAEVFMLAQTRRFWCLYSLSPQQQANTHVSVGMTFRNSISLPLLCPYLI
jgi:hypothetical protein